jgi:pimeloyl-ACP methyl ester carboxylesterase
VTRDVVLVPGLWMPAAAVGLLASRLVAGGYAVHHFAHHGRSPMEANIERLGRLARETLGGRPAHYVGHSLGGVLLLEALQRHAELALGNVVLLGAPVRGSLAGRRFARMGLARWMMGSAQRHWAEREARWRRPELLGVVAGTLPFGIGRALGDGLPGAHDGVVRVEETTVEGMAARAEVPVGHSMLLVSSRVVRLVERFLAHGSFE